MMAPMPISADEKRWRAEEDARVLAEAEKIKTDQPRLDAAQTAAKRMAEEEAERAKAMRKVAGSKKKPGGSGPVKSRAPGSRVVADAMKNKNPHNVFKRI